MVAADRTSLHLVGDDDSSKRRQILDGAGKVFMDLGFDGASMGEIARAAGVSKGTLYVYFADKNRLFEAIVEREMLDQQKVVFNLDPGRDVATTLRDFGQTYIELLCRPGGGSSIRTVMAIAERMPEVGRRFYEQVLENRINRLAHYLQAHARTEELDIGDCKLAAEQFMLVCQASLFLPFIFQAAPPPSAERIARSGRKRDADVFGRLSDEVRLSAGRGHFHDSIFKQPRKSGMRGASNGLVVRDAPRCRAPHHEGLTDLILRSALLRASRRMWPPH